MKSYQFSFALPFTPSELYQAQKYLQIKRDSAILSKTDESVSYLSKSQHSDNEFVQSMPLFQKNGQISHMKYHLNSSFPPSIREILNGKTLEVEIHRIDAMFKSRAIFSIEAIPDLYMEYLSFAVEGDRSIKTPFYIKNEDDVNYENIDVMDYFKSEKSLSGVKDSLRTRINSDNISNWKSNTKEICTLFVLIKLDHPFHQVQSSVNALLIANARLFFLNYIRSIFSTYESWRKVSQDGMLNLEQDLLRISGKKVSAPIFSHVIKSVDDLYSHTKISKFLKDSNYTPSTPSKIERLSTSTKLVSILSPSVRLSYPRRVKLRDEDFIEEDLKASIEFNSPIHMEGLENTNSTTGSFPKKSGILLKRGDGPFDYNWNERYVILDGQLLMYFKYATDKTPRGVIKTKDSTVSEITRIDDQDFAFTIDTPDEKKYFFSCSSRAEALAWISEIAKNAHPRMKEMAPSKSYQKRQSLIKTFGKRSSITFESKEDDYEIEEFPFEVSPFQRIFEHFKDHREENKWQIMDYTNGVKLFARGNIQIIHPLYLLVLVLPIVLNLILRISLMKGLVVLLVVLGFGIFKIFKSKRRTEVVSMIILDEDYKRVFRSLRKIRKRKQWDFNLQEISKSPANKSSLSKLSSQNVTAKYKFTKKTFLSPLPLGIHLENRASGKFWRFVFNEDYGCIVEKGDHFDQAIFVQKLPKISGKCIVYVYNKLSSYNIANAQFLISRGKRFSCLKDFMLSERIDQIQTELNPKRNTSFDIEEDFPIELSSNQIFSHAKTLEGQSSGQLKFRQKDYEPMIAEINTLIQTGDIQKPAIPIYERRAGYKRVKKGGLQCTNNEELKSQEGIVLELLRTVGKTLMEGKNVVGVSLPVRIFEPRSSVERICDAWAFAPIYLRMASRQVLYSSSQASPIERMKLVITYVVAGLHNVCKQLKPFNPILGETFQGYFDDGTSIFVEHTSHHPPISSFYIQADGYKIWGFYEYRGRLTKNSLIASQEGPTYIQFSDGQTIKFRMPSVVIGGLIFGDRVITWSGIIPFEDIKNNLKGTMTFYEGGFLSNQHSLDYLSGQIVKANDPNFILSSFEGSWLEKLNFDGRTYWMLEKVSPALLIKTPEPLPSDCRFREDLIALAGKNLEKAQESKIRLEVIQREDRKLRADFKAKKSMKS